MKHTAVDFLSEKYMYVTWLRNRDEISAEQADNMRAQYLAEAKEMEKEQIMEAHLNGQAEWDIQSLGDTQKKLSEQYYKETFLNKEK